MAFLRGWGVVAALLVAVAWFSPNEARAFPAEPYSLDEGSKAHSQRLHLLGELAIFGGGIVAEQEDASIKAVVLSPLFDLRLQLAENWLLDAAWGFSYLNLKGDLEDNKFRAGNPFIAFHYQGVKGQFSYRFGAGVTIPVATIPDDLDNRFTAATAYSLAAALRGNWNYWLWDPHSVSVIFPLAFERRKPSGFLWGIELDAGVMLSIDANNDRNNAIIEMAGTMGYQAVKWLRVGSRFSLVIIPKLPPQETQLAVEPYVRFGKENAFGSIRMLINLNNFWGFSFDENKVWGLRIGGGAAF